MNKVTFGKRDEYDNSGYTPILLNGVEVGYIDTYKHCIQGSTVSTDRWFVSHYRVVFFETEIEPQFEVEDFSSARSALAAAKRYAKAEALELAETAETAETETTETETTETEATETETETQTETTETTEATETAETEIETLQRSIADVDAQIKDLRWTQGRLTIKHMEGKQEALSKIVAIDDEVEVLAAKLKRLEDDLYEARIKAFGKSAGFVRLVGGKAYNEIQARHKRYSDKYYR